MDLNLKKSVMLMGVCSVLGAALPSNAYAGAKESPVAAVQQAKKVRGTVTDDMGPVIGATVKIKGTNNGVITDFDGKYSINAKPGDVLVITFVGAKPQEITVGNATTYNVKLESNSQELEEVVVVGYGVQKKKLVTGATVEVKGENIAKLNTTQALGALQSQTPGVNIQASSGQPGDGFKVTIRGAGTNGNTAPLYVIDGVSGGDINNINPADIERIDVLKDAASCAIYGSAAANGVILVTTKQGKAGKVQVSYDGYMGWSNIYRLPQMLTAGEYMKVMDLVKNNSGETPYNWADYFQGNEQLLADYQSGANPGTNWVEALRNKNAVTTSHSLNITGGSDLSKFSMGLGYQYQDGVFGGDYAKSDFRRFTLRLNSEHVIYRNSKGMDVIKVGENLYYGHRQKQGLDDGNMYANQLSTMLRANPLIPIYNSDGDYFGYDDLKSSGFFNYTSYATNPIASLVNNQSANNKSVNHNLDVVGYIEIQPIKGLIYRGQVSYKQSTWTWRNFLGTYHLNDQGDQRTNESATNQIGTGWNWNTTNTLNYKFDIAKDNHFDVLVGTEYGESRPDFGFELSATATDAIISDFDHAYMTLMKNNTAATVSGLPSGDTRGMSYFGRLNYDFAEKYMFSAIIRADGSSMFAPGKRWGYFPSFSAGWVISNEKFMESLSGTLDFLKLRAGWGQNGNKNISAFQYEAAFAYDAFSNYSFGNTKDTPVRGASLSRLANADLTWETSEQLNIGLDARFFGGKLSFNADWYKKKTKDLLVAVPVSPTTGFSSQLKNAGTVENTGIEVALNWQDQIGKDFKYNIGYNIAYNKNEVTEVNSPQKYNNGGSDLLAQGTGYMARFEEGHPIGYFWGYKTAGVIQNAEDLAAYTATLKDGDPANSHQGSGLKVGDLKFVDFNGDGIVNDDDKTDLGNPTPDVTMGITLGASYKGFDINVTGYAALGQQVARSYRKFTDGEYENYTSEVYSYWNGEGTSNKYPMLAKMNTGVNWQSISDIYIENADYFRLQNLTLGYDFKTIWKNCPFQQLRLYVAAQNLFTITGYKGMDPENGKSIGSESWVTGVDVGNYPQPRTYMVGVNVKF
ncbi:MAG: TonB-dependent receptor [Prevotella sp.]|nr:TonB-dependent receptor [Prevotella sp.]